MNFSLVSGWWWMFVTSRRGEGEIWGEEKHRQVSATLVSDHCYWYLDFSIDYLYFLIEIYTGTATLSFYLLAFLAALAALYLPFVPEWVTATLEFWHKEWLLRLETLQTFGQGDEVRKKSWRKKTSIFFNFFSIFF